jgi:hypothetical protein
MKEMTALKRGWRVPVDGFSVLGLIVLFALALSRGWHWHDWRLPVFALAFALFTATLERFRESSWVHQVLAVCRALFVLAACWAEFHLPR